MMKFQACHKCWNTLPGDIREANSVASFKQLLKTYLFNLTHITSVFYTCHLNFHNIMATNQKCVLIFWFVSFKQKCISILGRASAGKLGGGTWNQRSKRRGGCSSLVEEPRFTTVHQDAIVLLFYSSLSYSDRQ